MSASMTLGPYCNDAVDAMNIINIIKWRVKMHGENICTCILHCPSILKHIMEVQNHTGTLKQKHDL